MKKWTYVLTLIALIGVLAACGSKSSTGTDAGSSNAAGGEGGR